MEKIGIFGGTFDPVHNEHIRMAERVKEELCLSRVVAVPTFSPPHKTHSECAPAAARESSITLSYPYAAIQVGSLPYSALYARRKLKEGSVLTSPR